MNFFISLSHRLICTGNILKTAYLNCPKFWQAQGVMSYSSSFLSLFQFSRYHHLQFFINLTYIFLHHSVFWHSIFSFSFFFLRLFSFFTFILFFCFFFDIFSLSIFLCPFFNTAAVHKYILVCVKSVLFLVKDPVPPGTCSEPGF